MISAVYITKSQIQKKKIKNRIYNVGGGANFSISLIELINFLKREKIFVKYSRTNWRDGDQKIFISDNSKVKNDFHWSPKINPKKGIKILIDWVIQNKKVISKVLGK